MSLLTLQKREGRRPSTGDPSSPQARVPSPDVPRYIAGLLLVYRLKDEANGRMPSVQFPSAITLLLFCSPVEVGQCCRFVNQLHENVIYVIFMGKGHPET